MLYSPDRPIVDYSVSFIWLMAVGTIVCAALWKKFTKPKESDEYELSQIPLTPTNKRNEKLSDLFSNLTCSASYILLNSVSSISSLLLYVTIFLSFSALNLDDDIVNLAYSGLWNLDITISH